jgi:Uma2 family endonuclease
MSMPHSSKFTVEQYLTFERAADERHVYLDGEVFAMAGESDPHGIITVNVVITLGSQLMGNPCGLRSKDTKVRSGLGPLSGHSVKGMFSYPDITVICGEPEYHDVKKDVVLNPKAIIEVLSPSTEAFDRGETFTRYRAWNPTLTDYLLVSQDKPQVEHFAKQANRSWSYRDYTGLDASVPIASIGCTLRLVIVYDRIVFGSTDEE